MTGAESAHRNRLYFLEKSFQTRNIAILTTISYYFINIMLLICP